MSANSRQGIDDAFGLLERLQGTVSDFTGREKAFQRELLGRSLKVRREFENAQAELDARLAAETASSEERYRREKQRVETRHQARTARISRAYESSRSQALEAIAREEGRRKYLLQKRMLDEEHSHAEALRRNDEEEEAFKGRVAANREKLARLSETARKTFRGYEELRVLSPPDFEAAEPEHALDPDQQTADVEALLDRIDSDLTGFRQGLLFRLARVCPPWLAVPAVILGHAAVVPVLFLNRTGLRSYLSLAASLAGLLGLVFALYYLGKRRIAPVASDAKVLLEKARRLHNSCLERGRLYREMERKRIDVTHESRTNEIRGEWDTVAEDAERQRRVSEERVEEKGARIAARNRLRQEDASAAAEREHRDAQQRLAESARKDTQRQRDARDAAVAKLNAENQVMWQTIEDAWHGELAPIYNAVRTAMASGDALSPEWRPELWQDWHPPETFPHAVKFGDLDVDVGTLCKVRPRDARLSFPDLIRFSLPLLLTFPAPGSILFETWDSGRDEAVAALNSLILRLLLSTPPGKLSFTIFDPVGLGQSFAGLMHLADHEETLVNGRIWTQPRQIEQRLSDLNEHMEKVIQMYLRNEYETLAEYNEKAGDIAEKYHFLVMADFPANLSEVAAARLLSIAASGARCGIYTLVHCDHRRAKQHGLVLEELRKGSLCARCKGTDFVLEGRRVEGARVVLESPPAPELATSLLHRIGRAHRNAERVEVPFSRVAPEDQAVWTGETSAGLRVPIGRTGATRLQYFALGEGTRQHALIAGKTGSGKSTLFHVLITNLSLWCSPSQVEFYLVDFKKGVEFKCYAAKRLPHARVVAIESDREFGLSVLRRVDQELKERGEKFRKAGVQDIAGYNGSGCAEPLPRTLVIVDEFQEFFVEDDRIAQNAALLLDRLVRQGRAFGIHVLLGSQTLGGAYTVSRTTLGQMVVRIALQCSEADSYLIMDDGNPAPRLLSRPGEAVYNDAAGVVEGNSPFQVVWLPEDERDACLDKIREQASRAAAMPPPGIVFEGNAPANVRENPLLCDLLAADAIEPAGAACAWLGAPNSIKGPTEVAFPAQSGSNLLVVGQQEEAALAMLSVVMVSLASQHPVGDARFFVLDGTPAGSPFRRLVETVVAALPHPVTVANPRTAAGILDGLVGDLDSVADEEGAGSTPATYLFVLPVQRFKKLRYDDSLDFSYGASDDTPSPASQFDRIIREGAAERFHVIACCDTYNSVSRFLSRKALSEFGMRVLFQMSAGDSASLIDGPNAGTLGMHRALLYSEQEGVLETFRPYAVPDREWFEETRGQLARLAGSAEPDVRDS